MRFAQWPFNKLFRLTLFVTIETALCVVLPFKYRQLSTRRSTSALLLASVLVSACFHACFFFAIHSVVPTIGLRSSSLPAIVADAQSSGGGGGNDGKQRACWFTFFYFTMRRSSLPNHQLVEHIYYWLQTIFVIVVPPLTMLVCCVLLVLKFALLKVRAAAQFVATCNRENWCSHFSF